MPSAVFATPSQPTTMPYNTRRKSLSLPSLGIALPRPARSPPAITESQHIAKRQKRSHSSSTSNPSTPASPPRPSAPRFDERPKSQGRAAADTPPPSPGGESGQTKIDTQGIDDIIVVGVIEQLEKTGNRPHLLKELATILSPTIPIVESSANPAAIISSRLATYLKRNWTALSRCPLDKKLVGTHPKRVYYFLSTCPHQPIPDDASSNVPSVARIISPSLSSAASEEADDMRSRDVRSPSPELDLSDYDDAASDPFTNQTHPPTAHNIAHNRRAQSPPLEKDEREFTQTATILQQRRRSQTAERERSASMSSQETAKSDVSMSDIPEIEDEESAARKNSEIAVALFGQMEHTNFEPHFGTSSPMLKPTFDVVPMASDFKPSPTKMETVESDLHWESRASESIELDELDDLFETY
ncbi:unnamed protein product [Periconia digitata]|uniref:GDS1 winged helix domain-containing protein n=1 Tax=Periconia digitata TaxID=1303443 RepID=A0A9W4UQQ6_9PLEO|nr:unnamed protein product [Periconia digitata]